MHVINQKDIDSLNRHLSEWSNISKCINNSLMIELNTLDFSNIAAQIKENERLFASVTQTYTSQFDMLKAVTADIAKFVAPLDDMNKVFRDAIIPAFEGINRSFFDLPARAREAVLALAESGWYLDLDMTLPDLWGLHQAIVNGDIENAESELVKHFDAREVAIESYIVEKFPQRALIVQAAFRAHRQGEFYLSIPVLLTQADGICAEITNSSLFRMKDKRPTTAIYVETVAANTAQAAFLSPLSKILPINATESQRAGSTALNRHTVLHGESVDHGSKINSLKAISLLNYVGSVLRDHDTVSN